MKTKYNLLIFEGCNLSSNWREICTLNVDLRKEERSKISIIRFHHNKLQKEQFKLKVSRRKETVRTVANINYFENGK